MFKMIMMSQMNRHDILTVKKASNSQFLQEISRTIGEEQQALHQISQVKIQMCHYKISKVHWLLIMKRNMDCGL